MYVKVTGDRVDELVPPETVRAQRPRYLNWLVDLEPDQIYDPIVPPATNQYNHLPVETAGYEVKEGKTIAQVMTYDFPGGSPGLTPIAPTAYQRQPVRFVINNMTFSHELAQATFPVGQVIEVLAKGVETHSWHMHTHPVQFVEFVNVSDYQERWGGYFEVGDWSDVLQLPNTEYDVRAADQALRVRFQTDCYTGPLVIHCHVLYHEDLGMMTWFNTVGEDHTYSSKFENKGIFKNPPGQCMKPGQQCAPAYCSDYQYARGTR